MARQAQPRASRRLLQVGARRAARVELVADAGKILVPDGAAGVAVVVVGLAVVAVVAGLTVDVVVAVVDCGLGLSVAAKIPSSATTRRIISVFFIPYYHTCKTLKDSLSILRIY